MSGQACAFKNPLRSCKQAGLVLAPALCPLNIPIQVELLCFELRLHLKPNEFSKFRHAVCVLIPLAIEKIIQMAKNSQDRALFHCPKCGFAKKYVIVLSEAARMSPGLPKPQDNVGVSCSNVKEPAMQPGTEVTPGKGTCRSSWPEAEVSGQGQQQPPAQPCSPWVTALTAMPKQGLKTSCHICC